MYMYMYIVAITHIVEKMLKSYEMVLESEFSEFVIRVKTIEFFF